MSKKFKSIAATTAAISTLALTGCGNVVEKTKPTYEQSYIDESHSIHDENTSLVIVDGFSDMDRSIASSIKHGHFFFTNMMRGNDKITFESMLKFNLGKDFGVSKGDRYVTILDRTIENKSIGLYGFKSQSLLNSTANEFNLMWSLILFSNFVIWDFRILYIQ